MITALQESTSFSYGAVSFLMDSTELNSIVRNDALEALLSRNIAVYTNATSADTILACNAQDATLSYGEIFTGSFFGARMVERTLSLTMQVNSSSQFHNRILSAKKITVSKIDTVLYTDIQNLEDPSLPLKTLSQPQLSFFDSFLEPVIITVASAVAIYLFFTIRS
ncbi:MAG: hypothetical protein HYV29_07830 [Ignavibacteriales bacterium]|nr:hypothetical protein [Ignavibacteriales bacterium]